MDATAAGGASSDEASSCVCESREPREQRGHGGKERSTDRLVDIANCQLLIHVRSVAVIGAGARNPMPAGKIARHCFGWRKGRRKKGARRSIEPEGTGIPFVQWKFLSESHTRSCIAREYRSHVHKQCPPDLARTLLICQPTRPNSMSQGITSVHRRGDHGSW